MSFHHQWEGGFGGRPLHRGGQVMRQGPPPRQQMVPHQGAPHFGRYMPPRGDSNTRFFGPVGPQPLWNRVSPQSRGFFPRSRIAKPRFQSSLEVRNEALSSLQHKNSVSKSKDVEDMRTKDTRKEEVLEASNKEDEIATVKEEFKEEAGEFRIKLDHYNCDLHFNSDETGLVGWPLHTNGFEYLWGGGRATHGVKNGKVAFECTVLEALPVDVPETEKTPHVLRVGWSIDGADFQLGEDLLSYGYGGTGKISVNSKFSDYGRPFAVGDVITCCLDLDAMPKAVFYLLNGEYMGVAFNIGPELGDRALFPHITVKNIKFQINFGSQWPRYPITPGFSMLQNVPIQDLIRAVKGPETRQDAEVIMMVGLPSCGKTVWAEKHCKEHPDKRFYMLGTNNIIDKMRIFGLTRKRNYHGRWDALIKQATGCLNTWLKISEKRIGNYILDQTNVYFTARRRKMNCFKGYRRIACVIINEEKVLLERSEKVQREEGKVVPISAIMEMKANFSLPEVGESFDEVRYVELKPPRAREVVEGFVHEGQEFKRGQGLLCNEQEPKAKVQRLDLQVATEVSPVSGETRNQGEFWVRSIQPYPDRHETHVSNYDNRSLDHFHQTAQWPARNTTVRSYNFDRHASEEMQAPWVRGQDSSQYPGQTAFMNRNFSRFEGTFKQEPLDNRYDHFQNQRNEEVEWKSRQAEYGAKRREKGAFGNDNSGIDSYNKIEIYKQGSKERYYDSQWEESYGGYERNYAANRMAFSGNIGDTQQQSNIGWQTYPHRQDHAQNQGQQISQSKYTFKDESMQRFNAFQHSHTEQQDYSGYV